MKMWKKVLFDALALHVPRGLRSIELDPRVRRADSSRNQLFTAQAAMLARY